MASGEQLRTQAKRRRWLRASLIAFVISVLLVVLGGCASVAYVHTLWESGNFRCGKTMRSDGWGIGFNGKTDAFVCTVNDAQGRVVAQREIPVEEVMGKSGGWPYFPALVAHELEAVDADAP